MSKTYVFATQQKIKNKNTQNAINLLLIHGDVCVCVCVKEIPGFAEEKR